MTTLPREWLDYQADQIEALLAAHRQEALVVGVQISPRWVRFDLRLGLGTKISSIENLSEEMALALEAPNVRITRTGGSLAVEIPLPDPEPIHLLNLLESVPMLPPVTAVLGLTADGDPHMLPLMAPEVTHVLIAGATGCGKTELLRSLLLSLALYNRQAHLQCILIDPKRRGLTPLNGLPHLIAPVATSPEDVHHLLKLAVAEMERRDAEDAPPSPRIIIAVDEVGDLLAVAGDEVESLLVRLAQRGREAGFHLIVSTQRPSASAVPSSLKANLPARLVGKVASAQEALMASGISGTNAEMLIGSGDFIAVVGGQITRFQAAYSGPSDIRRIVRHLQETEETAGYSGQRAAWSEASAASYAAPEDAGTEGWVENG
jgi:S-DNA-T family DNA segregation ATPase FtsK/SpoIIIE